MHADIAILGAGPAGCAAALTLRRYLPELAIALVSEAEPTGSAVGEALSPGALPLMQYLGIQPDFHAVPNVKAGGTASAWGTGEVMERAYLFSGAGHGWLLDRRRFNSWLVDQVHAAGAAVVTARARLCGEAGDWHLAGATITATTIIDATGRAALLARHCGAARVRQDHLVADASWYELGTVADTTPGILVEAGPTGWWYSAGLPQGRAVAMFMTDAALLKQEDPASRLSMAPATAARLGAWRPTGETALRPAWSQTLSTVAGSGWVATGDAAAAFDPLSSLGIGFALRSGIEAARVAAADLAQDDGPREAYLDSVRRITADYRRRLTALYRQERRWADAPFWASRQVKGPMA